MKKLKYLPKIFTAISYFLLLIIFAMLFAGRTHPTLRSESLLKIAPDLYQHISNCALSYLLYSAAGYILLLTGIHFRYIIYAGVSFILINFIYEIWIPVLNTPDLTDAYYGVAGTAIAFIFLLSTYKFGMIKNKHYEPGN